MKLCTKCGVGNHSLEGFQTMLEKMINIKNVNVLSSVPKCDVVKTKNLQIVTQQDTKNGIENPHITKFNNKDDYPNLTEHKQLYNNVARIFQEIVAQEDSDKV